MGSFVPTSSNDSNNFLNRSKAVLTVPALRNFELYCKSFSIPAVMGNAATMDTPFVEMHFSPDKLTFEPLVIDFHVREDLTNWSSLIQWIKGLGFPEEFEQYKERPIDTDTTGILHVFTGENTANTQIKFYNLFPVSVQGLSFDVSDTSADPVVTSAVFRYDYFTVVPNVNA